MKQILITLSFFLIAISAFAQSEIQVTHSDKIIGKNLKTNSDILATEYVFPERIDHTYLDTVSNLMTVQLRGITPNDKYLNKNGDILLYDMAKNNIKWSKKLNYYTTRIMQQSDMIIRVEDRKSYCMNSENGEDKWEAKNMLYIVNGKEKIGIGFNSKSSFKGLNMLEGIDLQTGNVIWKREISTKYEWNSNYYYINMWDGAFQLNDSLVVASNRGLHGMNFKTGKGWDYDATILTFRSRGYIHELLSNIVIDSSSIYMASKTQITRLDYNGKNVWSQPLPEDSTSTSSIFIKDSLLYMVNLGRAVRDNNKQIFEGKPYLASYSLKTGNQHLLKVIEGKKQQINGFKVRKDTILLTFKNKISKFSLKDGSLIYEKPFVNDSLKEPLYFIGGMVYIKADSTYKRLESIDSTKLYVTTGNEKVIKVNEKLDVMNEVDPKEFYYLYLKTKDYRFIAKESETIILDKADKIVATLQATSNSKLIGSKLYDNQKQNLVVIDLSNLIMR